MGTLTSIANRSAGDGVRGGDRQLERKRMREVDAWNLRHGCCWISEKAVDGARKKSELTREDLRWYI